MARNYRVSVNGKTYDVPAPVAAPAAAPAPVAAPAPAPAAAAAPVPAGAGTVTSPMPGKIWKLPVKQGDAIAEGQLVLILEAMKMENEIYAPVGGTITSVNCKEGDSVNTGDVLLVIG